MSDHHNHLMRAGATERAKQRDDEDRGPTGEERDQPGDGAYIAEIFEPPPARPLRTGRRRPNGADLASILTRTLFIVFEQRVITQRHVNLTTSFSDEDPYRLLPQCFPDYAANGGEADFDELSD